MITLILGDNAIGKSVYLKNKVKERVSVTDNIIYNGAEFELILKHKSYNKQRLNEIQEVLEADEIVTSTEELTAINSEIEFTGSFKKIVSIICREVEEIYLDEPEFGLSSVEISYLVRFIYRILDTFENMEIVTGAELFLMIVETDKKTITVKDGKFELTNIEEGKYNGMNKS